MDRPQQFVSGDGPKPRFGAVFLASGAAITFLLPISRYHGRHLWFYVPVLALIPALIAWLMVRNRPANPRLAFFRGVAAALGLVGAGGLALLTILGHLGGVIKEAVESAGFETQAAMYLGAGVLGLVGSFLFGHGEPKENLVDRHSDEGA